MVKLSRRRSFFGRGRIKDRLFRTKDGQTSWKNPDPGFLGPTSVIFEKVAQLGLCPPGPENLVGISTHFQEKLHGCYRKNLADNESAIRQISLLLLFKPQKPTGRRREGGLAARLARGMVMISRF